MNPRHQASASRHRPDSPSHRGFTLVEILVVLGVIIALMGIAIPTLRSARLVSLNTLDRSQLRQLGVAHLAYQATNTDYFVDVGLPHGGYGNEAASFAEVRGRYSDDVIMNSAELLRGADARTFAHDNLQGFTQRNACGKQVGKFACESFKVAATHARAGSGFEVRGGLASDLCRVYQGDGSESQCIKLLHSRPACHCLNGTFSDTAFGISCFVCVRLHLRLGLRLGDGGL